MEANWTDKEMAEKCRYYNVLNFTRSEVNDSDECKKKIQDKYKQLARQARIDRKGAAQAFASQLNCAKDVLADPALRRSYNAALDKFQLSDGGGARDAQFDYTL